MNKETLISAMRGSISNVLETMFFLPVEVADGALFEGWWSPETDSLIVTELDFEGGVSGAFFFFIPRRLGPSLAASFMGEDEGAISDEYISGTAKELINMIAGDTFALWDDEAVFDLGIPKQVDFAEAEKAHSEAAEAVFLGVSTLDDRLALEVVFHP